MESALSAIVPVFALIFVGWLIRRCRIVSDQACTELNKFVVYLALPALLFDIVATADWKLLWQPGFVLGFLIVTLALFAVVMWVQKLRGRLWADAALDALNSSYANTGFIGFPLLLSLLGASSQTYVLLATILTVSVLFAVAIVCVEAAQAAAAHPAVLISTVLKRVSRNPLVLAPCCAALVPLAGWQLPAAIHSSFSLLGQAAAPCALVTIGLFLGGRVGRSAALDRSSLILVAIKLVLHPLLVYLTVTYLLDLPALAVACAVLLAALPTGTGPFMLAEFYQRDCAVTSDTILLSTLLAPLTLSVILLVLGPV